MATYLDFERRLNSLQRDIQSARLMNDDDAVMILQNELDKETKKVYSNLSDYQKLQLARHPDRPYSLDYIELIMSEKHEIFGDRHYRDDKSMVCFIGKIDGEGAVIIGHEKGRGTKNKIIRNFGMTSPEGYRKALRVAKMAEKFHLPILMLVDTAGAYPGIGAEERGQSEAIAKNLQGFASLKTPTVSVIIGEGGSGGALAISVSDRLAMLEHSVFSVISPEGCAAILWNDPTKTETAMKAMKITPHYLKSAGLIDEVIKEPLCGAHRNREDTAASIKKYFLDSLAQIRSDANYLYKRYDKFMSYGSYKEL